MGATGLWSAVALCYWTGGAATAYPPGGTSLIGSLVTWCGVLLLALAALRPVVRNRLYIGFPRWVVQISGQKVGMLALLGYVLLLCVVMASRLVSRD